MAHSKVISGEAAEAGTGVSPRYIYAGLKSRLASWPESTGKGDWFTGPDGVDRYEIDDSQSRFDDERFQEFNEYNKSLRSEEHTSELQSLMRISSAVFCLKKNNDISHTL